MRLIDADAMYERFVNKREGLDGIYDPTDLPDMLGDMPTVEAIPVEWLKQQIYDKPQSLWACMCRDVYTRWQKARRFDNASDRH